MNEESKKQIENEANIMKRLSHPNVVSFREVFKDIKLDYFYIVMEYADDGDLSKKIQHQQKKTCKDKHFSENKILKYFYQICKGIEYIHSKNIIHRDIKSQNIFLMKNGTIKIGDFGIAKALTKTNSNAMTVIGTPYYFSPEIINGEAYNYKTDIWSLGVVLYEMCNLKLPFDSNNIAQLSIKILRGNYDPIPFKYNKEMHHLIKRMLNVDQNKRPDIKEIMQSSLLKNYNLNLNNDKRDNINKKKKNCKNHNQKNLNINSTASNFNFKLKSPIEQKKERKRIASKSNNKNKDKSVSPMKFKNKSFMNKIGFINKNNENLDSSLEFPKKTENNKSRKSKVIKRNVSQKMISVKSKVEKEKEEKKIIDKDKNINSSKNININNEKKMNINNIDLNKFITTDNSINKQNEINNNINKFIDKNNNIIKTDISSNQPKKIIQSIYKNKNVVNPDINNPNNNLINSKPIMNSNKNKNLFYNDDLINKFEIISRSNAFDANFSGKSILFNKEQTINLLNETNNINEQDKNKNRNFSINNNNDNFNNDIIHFDNIYNFNDQSIKMFTLKEEDEEKETLKSNSNLYNGDADNLNFIIQNNTNKLKDNNNNRQNESVNSFSKEENEENVLKVDLDFEIINNSMNNENEDLKENSNKEKEKDSENYQKNERFDLEEYIKSEIGEKMYDITKEYLINMNIEQIVNYSFEEMINKLNDIFRKKNFRERQIKKAEKYLFDIFYIIINKKL